MQHVVLIPGQIDFLNTTLYSAAVSWYYSLTFIVTMDTSANPGEEVLENSRNIKFTKTLNCTNVDMSYATIFKGRFKFYYVTS